MAWHTSGEEDLTKRYCGLLLPAICKLLRVRWCCFEDSQMPEVRKINFYEYIIVKRNPLVGGRATPSRIPTRDILARVAIVERALIFYGLIDIVSAVWGSG